ncbi:speckle-type POZ protein B-like [Nasonia vitripennis]|uniref:Roadkill n=1 Tax=Nasonia vitripennis TaxID=7425 RepID=A0A7M7G7I6_NASVI|nr:speckle-type POZ protein B-like [Nasonia vitripennis]XP_016838997.1 speckle-type POZ protein B-like [Nasonia vitripennis]
MDANQQQQTSTADSWCQTHVNVVETNFMWTISNFSFCNEKPAEALESTTFSADSCDSLKWRMQFYPSGNNQENKDYVSLFLHLVSCDKPAVKVDFRFCILDKDGREVNERKTTEKWQFYQGRQSGFPKFVKRDIVLDPASGLLLADQLRVMCRIKSATGRVERTSQEALQLEGPRGPDLLSKMSLDFEQLIELERFSDVCLIVVDEAVRLPAHRNVLAARSPVFAAMFEHDMRESQDGTVQIYDFDAETIRAMLRYIYTGRLDDIELRADKLLGAADKYALDGLKFACEQTLCAQLSVPAAAEYLVVAELHSAYRLKAKALSFVRANLKQVIDTPGFKSLGSSQPCLLEEILRSMTER